MWVLYDVLREMLQILLPGSQDTGRFVSAVMYAGLARGHRANIAACLRIESVYGTAVLLSGLASLVLSSKVQAERWG